MKTDIVKRIQEIEKSYCLLIIQEILDDSDYEDLDFHTKTKLGCMVTKHSKLMDRIEV